MIRLLLTSVAAVTLLAAPVAANAATKHMKMRSTHTTMRGGRHTTMRARPTDSRGTDALNDQALAAARGTGPAPTAAPAAQ